MVNERIRIGIIGCGGIFQIAHLPALKNIENVEIVGVCDVSEEVAKQIAQYYSIPSYFSDYKKIAEDKRIDAVLITTPEHTHAEIAIHCMENKKHILVEKPMAKTIEECERMIKVSEKNNVKLQVGFMKRFDPALQKAHEFLNEIGEILLINVWMYDSIYHSRYARPFLPPRIFYSDEQIHNCLSDIHLSHMLGMGIHQADLINWFGGKVKSVSSIKKEMNGKVATSHIIEFESGAIGSFQFLRSTQMEWSEGILIHGTKGSIKVDIPFPYLRRASEVLLCKEGKYIKPIFPGVNQYQLQLEYFINSILQDKPSYPSGKDGLEAEKLIYAMYYSAETGEKLNISDLEKNKVYK